MAKLKRLFQRVVPAEKAEEKRQKKLAYQRKWAKANIEKRRGYRRKHRYGLTNAEYNELLAAQGGVCATCRKPQDEPLAIDHDHNTDEIRGLLCHLCNMTLGSAKDDVDTLKRMIAYLEEYRAKRLQVVR